MGVQRPACALRNSGASAHFPSATVAEWKATMACIKLVTFRRHENLHPGTEPTALKKKIKSTNAVPKYSENQNERRTSGAKQQNNSPLLSS